jgi:hypothetical protein
MIMKHARRGLAAIGVALATIAFGATVAPAAQLQQTMLPFAQLGNIRSWQPDGRDAIYIQSGNRKWYRATFWSPCNTLPFAFTVAFVTKPNGNLDRFSSILVDGERCWFRDFHATSAPPNDDNRHDVTETEAE